MKTEARCEHDWTDVTAHSDPYILKLCEKCGELRPEKRDGSGPLPVVKMPPSLGEILEDEYGED